MQRYILPAFLCLLVLSSLSSAQTHSVTLACTPSGSGTPAVSYNFYRSLTLGTGYALIGNSATCSYVDSGIDPAITYYYVSAGVDASSNVGAFSIPVMATQSLVTNNTSACSANGLPTSGCNTTTIMPFLGNPTNTGLQTTVLDPVPTRVSTLSTKNLLYSGATTRVMMEYQPWFCNTSNPCNGHQVNGMQETNATQLLWQLQWMKSIGADVTDVDYYGCASSCTTPQSSAQAFNLSVTQGLASAIATNPATTPTFEIMLDGGAINGTGTGQCPAAAGDQSACLIAAINTQMDYLAQNWLFQSYYEKNATSGHPIVLFFLGSNWPNTNFSTVFAAVKSHATSGQSCGSGCTYSSTVDLVDENSGAFTETGIDGGYAWPQPLSYSPTNQFLYAGAAGTYLSGFYSTARANPTKIAIGAIYKGFDDNKASWGSNRVIAQECGQTLKLTANAIGTAGYNSGSQLQYVQLVTFNDYEEGTEIETGVNNCISIGQPTLAGGNITWTLNKSDLTYAATSTISSFSIYTGAGSPTTLYASGIPATATTFAAPLPAAGQSVWVYMVGQPLIQNQLSPAAASSNCAMPNPCTYNGVEIIQWGSIPNFGGLENNNAVGFDTSLLTHVMFDGTTFTSGPCPGATCALGQITRLTGNSSSPGKFCNYTAGEGGSAEFPVTNTNTSLAGFVCNGSEYIGLFNTSGANIGHFSPVNGGVFITTDLCQAGSLCTVGTSAQTQDFGSLSFSQTDPSIAFNFGGNSFDITTANGYDGLTVCPYQINYAASTPIIGAPRGAYNLLPCLVDFKFGLPQQNAQSWLNGHGYRFGNYVIHNLTPAEMATGGIWTTAHTYALGDIVVGQGGSTACMYRVTTAGGVATSGASPAFLNTAPCKVDILTDAAGNKWRGTNGTASFLYQNTNPACTVSVACTSGASFTIGAGHPDLMTTVTEGAGATKNIWTNVGPAYVPTNANQLWQAIAGTSKDCTYVVSGLCFPSKYGIAISTNTYGDNLAGGGYAKYAAGQGTGTDLISYDATANAFQHLNTLTGIWNTYTCGTGNGLSCGAITSATVGTAPLTAIANPLGTGQACPYFIHNMKTNTVGTFARVTNQANVFSACNATQNFQVWNLSPSSFNAATSLQITFGGMNHSAVDTTEMFAYNGGKAVPGGFEGGWFDSVYQMNAAGTQPGTSVYLKPGANLPGSLLYPTGCNTNTNPSVNPDCNLSNALDSHVSCVGGCEDRALHACGTTYNYATFSPIAFNAWQNMETCYPTGTVYQVGSLPTQSAGAVSQFTHTFATGTSNTFSTQFQISEWSQDGNWLFWSTDYACQLGSMTGASPGVWSSGTHIGFLATAYSALSPLPSTLTALCGLPWIPASVYQVGNTFNPLETTSVSGGADDVFQVIASCVSGSCATTTGTGTGVSGPANQPGGSNNQPVCVIGGVNKSCFASTNAPTATTAGDTVCDNTNWGFSGGVNTINPSLPYSTSCPNGIVSQDVGPQTQRGDVFAVQLAGYGGIVSSIPAPATIIFVENFLHDIPIIGGNL